MKDEISKQFQNKVGNLFIILGNYKTSLYRILHKTSYNVTIFNFQSCTQKIVRKCFLKLSDYTYGDLLWRI